ncbi:MAG: hypothetical protein IPO06_20085 [Leptospiraceae bacterium]|nr:hypothetical protein [Leptospiraceae bacterium]MBK7058221.1 hypothetical protein [Leptospiraceae bacterium]MBK9501634.1 hypothetical protein [Leptospiraceae bacterium]
MNIEKAHTEKLTRLSNLILKRIEKEIEPSLEKNLARLIHLLSDIEKSNNFLLLQKAEMAFVAMTKSKPNLELAELLIEDLEDRLSVNIKVGNFLWRSLFTLNSPLSIVLFGIFVTTILGHIAVFLGYKLLNEMMISLNLQFPLILITVLSAGWGSVLSMATRLTNAETKFYDVNDHRVLFLTGFFKPIIGVIFSLFISALVMSGFIPLNMNGGNDKYIFAIIGFLSGFSERFAKDIISKTEKSVLSKE